MADDTFLLNRHHAPVQAPSVTVTPTGGAQTALGDWMALPVTSVANGLVAHAGGGQGSATALTASINRVSTVASAADSVVLMASKAGYSITVINAGANSMNVFPASGETINGGSANTALAVASGKTAEFVCPVAGAWHAIVSA